MSDDRRARKIAQIQNGIVIDHIRKGRALTIARLLKLGELSQRWDDQISIGINHSSKIGIKDYIKIENFELSRVQLSCVALVSPCATINVIRDTQVVEKLSAEVPDEIGDIVTCPDPYCITNHEQIPCRFHVVAREPLTLSCHYCELEFYDKLIAFKL